MADPVRFQRVPMRQREGQDEGGAFTDPVFDDEYYGRDRSGGRARTIALGMGVLVGAVIAGAAAWYVFGPGGEASRGQTPLIAAQPEPYKVRPENPGGLKIENQDKLVYGRVGGGAPEPRVENILPPPERPKALVAAAPDPKPAPPATVVQAPAAPVETPAQPAAPPEPAPEQVTTIPEPSSQTVDTPAQLPPVTQSGPTDQTPSPEPKQTLESMVAALSGDYLIQIAALRSEEDAKGEWDRVSGRYPALLGSYEPMIVRADLGERGIFYRLRAGPLASRSAAEQLCTALSAEKVGCLVVRNE